MLFANIKSEIFSFLRPAPFWFAIGIGLLAFQTLNGMQVDKSLEQPASWDIPDAAKFIAVARTWVEYGNSGDGSLQEMTDIIEQSFAGSDRQSGDSQSANSIGCELISKILVVAFPGTEDFVRSIAKQKQDGEFPVLTSIEKMNLPESARQNLRLLYARWLVQNEFYDEARSQFKQISLENVLDPAAHLFYEGLCCHRLLEKEECVRLLDRLNENDERIARRYSVVSRLMIRDIQPLEPDSLDEIARMMDDIRRRQSLSRSGKIVRNKEDQVLKKLDKMIEELEQQQQQMSSASSSDSSTPMKDSQRAGGMGSGQAKIKQQFKDGEWGALPPQERAAALADMTKDLPPHYREVIEEYFRQLAKEKK